MTAIAVSYANRPIYIYKYQKKNVHCRRYIYSVSDARYNRLQLAEVRCSQAGDLQRAVSETSHNIRET